MRKYVHKGDKAIIEKLVKRSARSTWMAPNKYNGIIFIHLVQYHQ